MRYIASVSCGMSKIDLRQGDCLEVMKGLPDNSVDLIVTDPPYEFTKGTNGGGGMCNTRKSHKEIHTNLGGQLLDVGISDGFLQECKRVLKVFNFITFCNSSQLFQIISFAENNKYQWNLLVWHKTNPIPLCNNKYLDDIEYIVQIKEKGKLIKGNYHTKSKVFTSQINKKDKLIYNHPTIKPLELITKFIINHSDESDTVLDPFMGSGTTGVACKNLNRDFIGIEISEEYYNIAQRRISETKQI